MCNSRSCRPLTSVPCHWIGGGWAGFNIALNAKKDVPLTVVSPRNHFLFSPLLASTAVGTLEFRCIQEPIRTVLSNQGRFLQAKARSLDPVNKKLVCESVHNDTFELEYDKLVIAVGVKTNVSFVVQRVKCWSGRILSLNDCFELDIWNTIDKRRGRYFLSETAQGCSWDPKQHYRLF